MDLLRSELKANASTFVRDIPVELARIHASLSIDVEKTTSAYAAAAALQAWRTEVYTRAPGPIRDMLLEAQNDAVQSLVLGHLGMWRPALQSLRSCIEAVVRIAFFTDHPVELGWWTGKSGFSISIRKTIQEYLPKHPLVEPFAGVAGIPDVTSQLYEQYSLLSKAVHASAISFRMTKAGDVSFSNSSATDYGQWLACHRKTLQAVSLLMLMLNRSQLRGTAHSGLRKLLSVVLPKNVVAASRTKFGVVLMAK